MVASETPDGSLEDAAVGPLRKLTRAVTRNAWATRFLALEAFLFGVAAVASLALPGVTGSMLAAMFGSLGLMGLAVGLLYVVYTGIARLRGP